MTSRLHPHQNAIASSAHTTSMIHLCICYAAHPAAVRPGAVQEARVRKHQTIGIEHSAAFCSPFEALWLDQTASGGRCSQTWLLHRATDLEAGAPMFVWNAPNVDRSQVSQAVGCGSDANAADAGSQL